MHGAGNVGHGVRGGVATVIGVAGGSRLSLRLALVLKPDGDRFYFPVISDKGRVGC